MVTLFKQRFSTDDLKNLRLNERQIRAVEYVKKNGSITNSYYQKINGVGKTTATKELSELVDLGVLRGSGRVGAGSYYELNG